MGLGTLNFRIHFHSYLGTADQDAAGAQEVCFSIYKRRYIGVPEVSCCNPAPVVTLPSLPRQRCPPHQNPQAHPPPEARHCFSRHAVDLGFLCACSFNHLSLADSPLRKNDIICTVWGHLLMPPIDSQLAEMLENDVTVNDRFPFFLNSLLAQIQQSEGLLCPGRLFLPRAPASR